ncbi:MAG TPA: site-specific integrase [Pirellulales bacterium]|jgi:integrase
MEKHTLLGGKLHLYKRPNSSHWQCSTFLAGRNWRISTKDDSLSRAKEIAEDWFFSLKGKHHAGELKVGKTFAFAAEQFLKEFEVITEGQRAETCLSDHQKNLRVHLLPYFGAMRVAEIKAATAMDYRVHRATSRLDKKTKEPKRPSRSTLHKEIVTLRQVLKSAQRHGWIEFVPDLSSPYRTSGKITHRAWFSPQEYRQLYLATRQRAKYPLKNRWRWECEQLHDYVLFMANTGLRPDEAARLEHRDVKIVQDRDTAQVILEIEVRGKRGVGYCKSTPGAVAPYRRLCARNKPQHTDRLFPGNHRELFNTILTELKLKLDRDGNRRTAYSLRHTYICLRLMEGADIYQIAKNCRTSVEMIETYYAAHLKTTLDASAINVRRSRPVHKGTTA